MPDMCMSIQYVVVRTSKMKNHDTKKLYGNLENDPKKHGGHYYFAKKC